MPNRALIIAIENYPMSEGLFSRTLSGTHEAAKAFYRWLIDVKKMPHDSIFICSDGTLHDPQHPPSIPGPGGSPVALISGASRPDVIRAITSLIDLGQDKTEELYIYFSGHGFGYRVSQYQLGVDVLITAEFHKQADSGGACIKLDELRTRLYMSVGGIDHYYFIDACRNVVPETAIQVLGLGISPPTAELGFPTMYTLYSVKYGEASPLSAKFPTALKLGLIGSGHAKGWVGGDMYVKFDLLCDYVDETARPPRVDSRREGNGKGTLLKLLRQDVLSDCTVTVDGAGPNDQFLLELTSGSMSQQKSFIGASFSMKLEPNDRTYSFRLTSGASLYELYDPPSTTPLDFYTSSELKFRLPIIKKAIRTEAASAAPAAASGELSVTFEPPGVLFNRPEWTVELESLRTGEVLSQESSNMPQSLPPGSYVVRLREDGVTAIRQLIRVGAGTRQTVDLLHREPTPTQTAILTMVNSDPNLAVADFSETLGPTAHWNLQLWLAYLGAAHIMRRPGIDHKLGSVPLASLDMIQAGQAAAFVLVVAKGGIPRFAVHRGRTVDWSEMKPVEKVPDLYQGLLPMTPGPTLLSVTQAPFPPLTFASCALPDRATLFISAPDATDRIDVQQFLLPLAHLHKQRSYAEEWWDRGPVSNLKLVGLISIAQNRFAHHKSVAPAAGKMHELWNELFQSKWTDPLLGLLALYDIVRRGKRQHSPYPVELVLSNLTKYFHELPDLPVLRRVLRVPPYSQRRGVPLFLDGVLASRLSDQLPLPVGHLDFNSSYTSWRNAVEQ